MRRARRIVLVLLAVLLVGIVALVLRTLDALGLFTEVAHIACSDESFIGGIGGADDLQFDAQNNALFIAVNDERAGLKRPSPKDGIYLWRPGSSAPPVKLAGTSADFHPSAMSLYHDADGTLTIMAVNEPGMGKSVVVIFDVTDPGTAKAALHEREAIASDLLYTPDAIVAVDKNRFYVTNIQTSKTFLGQVLEVHLLLPRANVIYFDGVNFRVAATGLRMATGIARSADGSHIYVGEMTGREIQTFAREPISGDLKQVGALPVETGVNDLHMSLDGGLYAVGHPKLFDLILFSRDPNKPSASEVFRITLDKGGMPQSASLVYAGTDIGAAGVSAVVDHRLLVGSGLSPKIMSCALAR